MSVTQALSLKQPWAYLVAHGPKDIENRSWHPVFRGWFYIHASQKPDRIEYRKAAIVCKEMNFDLPPFESPAFQYGGVVGAAKLITVLDRDIIRPWKFEGQYGYVLEKRRPLAFVPCAGALNFWRLPSWVLSALPPLPPPDDSPASSRMTL